MHWSRLTVLIFLLSGFSSLAKSDSSSIHLQALPSIFYTPETSWGGGLTTICYIKNKDSSSRNSNFQWFLDGTINRQLQFLGDYNFFTPKEKLYVKGRHDWSMFPEYYFGIGNETTLEDRCWIDFNLFNLQFSFLAKGGNGLFVGPMIHHQTMKHLDKPIELLGMGTEKDGYSFTGVGLNLLLDRRDNLLCPNNGYYIEAKALRYFNQMSSGYYDSYCLDFRYYHTFENWFTLNANVVQVDNTGDVPFRMMPALGGPRFMRGYYAGRFRDNRMTIGRIELRRPLFWRIGIAAFTDWGQVYRNPAEFDWGRFNHSAGMGLRFKIDQEENANIRFDYGRGKDSHGFYVVFSEAF
jgi:hypothetical protein